jgi:hypothetical protein
MTFASVSDALEQLAPAHEFVPDWDDVAARAGTVRRSPRRRWVVAAIVFAASLLPLVALAGAEDWWFFRFGSAPAPVTGVGVVKTGTWDGKRWVLAAFRSGTDGVCFSMMPAGSASSDGAGGSLSCDQIEGVPRTPQSKRYTPHGITYLMGGGSALLPAYIVGPVAARADEVEVHFANGIVLRTPTFEAPESLGSSIRFYAAQRPESVRPSIGSVEKLVGLDRNGRIVACLIFPMPEEGVALSACR